MSSKEVLSIYEMLDDKSKEYALLAIRQISETNDAQAILETLEKLSELRGVSSRNAPPIRLGLA